MNRVLVASLFAVLFIGLVSGLWGEDRSVNGSLRIRSYSEVYASDTSQITGAVKIGAIVRISGPGIDRSGVTDDAGFISFSDLPAGNYLVSPRFCDPSYAKSVELGAGESLSVELPTPTMGLYFWVFNSTVARPPLDQATFRRGLCEALARAELLGPLGKLPALSFLPPAFRFESAAGAFIREMKEDPAEAAFLLSPYGRQDLKVSFFGAGAHKAIYAGIAELWGRASSNAVAASPDSSYANLGQYMSRVKAHSFEVARVGWILDANDPLSLFKEVSDCLAVVPAELSAALRAAMDAKAAGDWAGYEKGLVTLNNILVDASLALPIHQL